MYIPISAIRGDNVVKRSENMDWYDGPTFLESLDTLKNRLPAEDKPMLLPVQDVYKIDDKRINAGRVETGVIESGMEVRPVVVGDRADIEIIPRISHEVSGREKGIIRFTRASTRLSVRLGQWINIGGADEESNEVMKAILESSTGKQGSSISISLIQAFTCA